jgi:hypothetical protein
MEEILISPFDNFFLFTIESQVNGVRAATDLSIYREAFLTFKDNEEYAVRVKSSPLFGQDSAKQGELPFTMLSYDAKQARKLKQRNFIISVIRDYPDGTSDETVIYTGTWAFFEMSAELEYNALSKGIGATIQANTSKIEELTGIKNTLLAEIAAQEEIVASLEAEKSSLETTLNANLAKLSSLKTSGRTIQGTSSPEQGAQTIQSQPEDTIEKNSKANIVVPETNIEGRTAAQVAAQRRGLFRKLISTDETIQNVNFR